MRILQKVYGKRELKDKFIFFAKLVEIHAVLVIHISHKLFEDSVHKRSS